jgi:dCMP deaminase
MNNEDTTKFQKYLLLSDDIALFSKDQSTKVGAVFLNKNETSPLSFGYNGMPRGVDETIKERHQRPEKYLWTEHAERNGIYNIAREVLEGHIMFSTSFPNMESARAISSTGIKKLILPYTQKNEQNNSYNKVMQLFFETNVEVFFISSEQTTKINKKYLNYLNILNQYAILFSPDHHNKNATMILNEKTFAPIENGFGVNSPPEKIQIQDFMHEENEKQYWFQESEKNAIFNAVKHKFEGTASVVCWCPCIHCSLAMVSVGITKIVTRKPDFTKEADLRWKESFERSQQLFKLANVNFLTISEKENIKNIKNKP